MLPVAGVMLQLTVLLAALMTVAPNCWVPPGVSVAVVGVMVTETVGVGVRLILAVPEALASASLVAGTVSVCALAIGLGAVYRPFGAMLPRWGLMPQM